jgi:hypothetical protein
MTVQMLLATLNMGAVSFICLLLTDRYFDAQETVRFLALWPLCNTAVLALNMPLEHSTPRLLSKSIPSDEIFRVGVLSTLLFGFSALLALSVISQDFLLLALGGVLILGFSVWYPARGQCIGHGHFGRHAVMSAALLSWLLFGVGFLLLADVFSLWGLLSTLASGCLFLGLWSLPRGTILIGKQRRLEHRRIILGDSHPLVYSHFASLAIVHGPLLLAPLWGLNSDQLLEYALSVNLIRVPFLALNTVLAPLNLRIINLRSNSKDAELRTLILRSLRLMALSIFLLALVTPIVFTTLIEAFYSIETTFSEGFLVLLILTEGVGWIGSLSRLFATSTDLNRNIRVTAYASFGTFVLLALLLNFGVNMLWIVPLIAHSVVCSLLPMSFARLRN